MDQLENFIEEIVRKFNVDNNKHVPSPEILPFDEETHIKEFYEQKKKREGELAVANLKTEFSEISSLIDQQTQLLKSKILPVLLAEKRSSFIFEQEEGELDSARIFRIPNGDSKVYKKRVLGKKLNTAISILCDISGSMAGNKMRMLHPTLLVIADTLFALKIPFEILAFSTDGDKNLSKNYQKLNDLQNKFWGKTLSSEDLIYNRFSPLFHLIIKSFPENYIQVRELIPLINAMKSNVDGEAVEWAAKRLARQREERKILMVLSDGMPANTTSDSYLLERHLKETVRKIEKTGIEVLGVGMLTSAPGQFYTSSVVINSIDKISENIYRALLEKLRN